MPGRPLYPPRLRACFQAAVIAALLLAGWELLRFALWLDAGAAAPAVPPNPQPPLAEAFLPGQALAGARLWLAGQGFDPVHPAGLTIFLAALLMALLARRGFCAFFCPLGFLSDGLGRLGRRLGLSRRPGRLVSTLISLPKYLLLALLLWFVFIQAAPDELAAWAGGPDNKLAAVNLLRFFQNPSAGLLAALALILAGSVLAPGFWCRGFCPYGALLGLVSLLSPLAVRRDKEKCTYCRRCTRFCPARISLHEAGRVSGPDCQGCLTCLSVCPEEGCLTLRAGYGPRARHLPPFVLPLLCAAIMAAAWLWSSAAGHWESRVPAMEIRFYDQFRPAPRPDAGLRLNESDFLRGERRSGNGGVNSGKAGACGVGIGREPAATKSERSRRHDRSEKNASIMSPAFCAPAPGVTAGRAASRLRKARPPLYGVQGDYPPAGSRAEPWRVQGGALPAGGITI